MPTLTDPRELIRAALQKLRAGSLLPAATALFAELGYKSDRRLPIAMVSKFRELLDPTNKLTKREMDALDQLKSLHLLFQLTGEDLDDRPGLFDQHDKHLVETSEFQSYLCFAADLPGERYTRTELATLVRAINKPLLMPALVLFRYGESITIGIIHRRLSKRDQTRDVLEKVTLIKDINATDPIRGHLEILADFSLERLAAEREIATFVELHEAWQKRLATSELTERFYREIADWYFWAHHQVEDGKITLPRDCDTEQEQSLFLIRLLTRVIFCWFLVEKRLIPAELFHEHRLEKLLRNFQPATDTKKPDTAASYYRAILQNLFFGTLNMPYGERTYREKKKEGERNDKNYGVNNLWRHLDEFADADKGANKSPAWTAYAKKIPFLNGGLFDCLDDKHSQPKVILDGFSENKNESCHLPNDLFFGPERTVDLSHDYGEDDKRTARSKKAKVRGLIAILGSYKFTVEENTPLEEEIALDPELLGKVFENLLASYNEDTRTTARKALGAFYTPREIVSYMVDETLKSYLAGQVPRCKAILDDLFSNKATLRDIKDETRSALIAAIGRVKILDPACGSGAFPMGALHRLVDLLRKLDPDNTQWQKEQIARATAESAAAFNTGDREARNTRLDEIKATFDENSSAPDYARKLYLIENCIYGIDIQPIATQIAKLRFFIALIVDQTVAPAAVNLGVRPLPNLDTRLVAADIGRAQATISKIIKQARQLFKAAHRRGLIDSNPFADIKAGTQRNEARMHFVRRDIIDLLLKHVPNTDWELILILSRYGGLRCPSEVLSLRWSDVKWADNEILVQSPKGEKYGKGVRKLPIFKELREPLQRAQAAAGKDTVYVVHHYRDSNNANLRTQLTRLLKKLGITQWPRLFHNLRASRETELLEKFPIQVVTAWLGNSPQIALQHYLQTTKEHFDRALTEDTEL